jgi:hypothetical protein
MLQRSDYTFDRLLAGEEAGRDLFGKKRKRKNCTGAQYLFDDSQVDQPNDDGEFLKKVISHYRRVQENG